MTVTQSQMTTMNVRVARTDKMAFEQFCASTGMNISVAVNMFVKAVLRTGMLPFKVEADPFYSEANQRRIQAGIEQLERGEGHEHELIEV